MDSATKDISEIRVPPADETLPNAFADLDAKLSDWKAAMQAAQEQLIEQAHAQAEFQEQLESRAAEQAQLQSQLDTEIESQKQVEDELKAREAAQVDRDKQLQEQADAQARAEEGLRTQAEAQAATTEQLCKQAETQAALEAQLQEQAEVLEQASETEQTMAEEAPPASSPPEWSNEDVRKHIKVYGDYAKPEAEPEPKASAPEANEDEALLASLDPETAKAIRVMRRMGGSRKSVRELLEQYQEARATSRTEPGRKSWFRRGR